MKKIFSGIIALSVLFSLNSCVEDQIFVGPASISTVAATPIAPKSNETCDITAKITDLKGVTSAKLYYKLSTEASFTSINMTVVSGFVYKGTIPAKANTSVVQYYIEVQNEDGLVTKYPATAPTGLATYTVGASTVVSLFINEVFADGTKDATNPDWVEIYNNSEVPVDLAGYFFYDQGIKDSNGTKAKRTLGSITIPSKGFTVISTEYNSETVTFGLSTSGDGIYLENSSGVLVASLDFTTIALTGGLSYGRKPDGSSTLVTFTTPTKGTSNNNAN